MSLKTLPGFDEATRRHAWDGETLPVLHQGQRGCRRCSIGELMRLAPSTQLTLFYHGGYGAAERNTYDLCLACGHVSIVHIETLNPRRFT